MQNSDWQKLSMRIDQSVTHLRGHPQTRISTLKVPIPNSGKLREKSNMKGSLRH